MAALPLPGDRVVVLGTTGCGKTTLARRLAWHLGHRHIELDALHWEPGWAEAAPEVFRERVTAATNGERWVLDGNYSKVRDIVWSAADTVVWLDYPLPLIQWRLFWRTLHRTTFRVALWNGNRERFTDQFFSRNSLFLWALKTHRRRRREYPILFQRPENTHLRVIRLCSPHDTAQWLLSVRARH